MVKVMVKRKAAKKPAVEKPEVIQEKIQQGVYAPPSPKGVEGTQKQEAFDQYARNSAELDAHMLVATGPDNTNDIDVAPAPTPIVGGDECPLTAVKTEHDEKSVRDKQLEVLNTMGYTWAEALDAINDMKDGETFDDVVARMATRQNETPQLTPPTVQPDQKAVESHELQDVPEDRASNTCSWGWEWNDSDWNLWDRSASWYRSSWDWYHDHWYNASWSQWYNNNEPLNRQDSLDSRMNSPTPGHFDAALNRLDTFDADVPNATGGNQDAKEPRDP